MNIAVASGKGGTGKTLVAANLAEVLSHTSNTTLVDCDVEEPNLQLFFDTPATFTDVTVPMPVFIRSRCDLCGACAEFCQYGAITVLPDRVLFFPELCHSCGGCSLVCPKRAIDEEPVRIGQAGTAHPSPNLTLISGILDEGRPHATPLIRAVKEQSAGSSGHVIFDASPGIACPVIETLDGCDMCILVTESTPFGLHDLRLAAEVVRLLDISAGVVINRSDGEDAKTHAFCESQDLPVLMTIPFEREIATLQNRGTLIIRTSRIWEARFAELIARCHDIAGGVR